MLEDRVNHSLACRRELQRQSNILVDTKTPLIERRIHQRNMSRQYNGGPQLMSNILNDLSGDEKANNVVFVPLDYDDKVKMGPKSPMKLVARSDMARAMKNSDALQQAYKWYIKHMRDRFNERFVYVCVYTPDVALVEMIALPDNSKNETGDKLEHMLCQCSCPTHRPKEA